MSQLQEIHRIFKLYFIYNKIVLFKIQIIV